MKLISDQQEKHGSAYTLTGHGRSEDKDYILTADKVSYDQETGDSEADGHVQLQGGRNNELIIADHGKLNLELETGRFENVDQQRLPPVIREQTQAGIYHRRTLFSLPAVWSSS